MGHPKKGILTWPSQQRRSNTATPYGHPNISTPKWASQSGQPKMGILSDTSAWGLQHEVPSIWAPQNGYPSIVTWGQGTLAQSPHPECPVKDTPKRA